MLPPKESAVERGNSFPSGIEVNATAIMPGTMTRNGKYIYGTAATSGVLRAAVMFFDAIARCTTRKLVHQ